MWSSKIKLMTLKWKLQTFTLVESSYVGFDLNIYIYIYFNLILDINNIEI